MPSNNRNVTLGTHADRYLAQLQRAHQSGRQAAIAKQAFIAEPPTSFAIDGPGFTPAEVGSIQRRYKEGWYKGMEEKWRRLVQTAGAEAFDAAASKGHLIANHRWWGTAYKDGQNANRQRQGTSQAEINRRMQNLLDSQASGSTTLSLFAPPSAPLVFVPVDPGNASRPRATGPRLGFTAFLESRPGASRAVSSPGSSRSSSASRGQCRLDD